MYATVRQLGAASLLLLASVVSTARAAEPDLRLITAVEARNTQAVRTLLATGVNVNTARADGVTPLLLAAHWDELDVVDQLLRTGATVNAAAAEGITPLALACENASAAMVAKLLAAGADPNAVQTNGVSPLMIAALTGHVAIVKALLAQGANVDAAVVVTGQTALMWATAERHLDVMRALLAAGVDVAASSKIGFTPLLFATRNNDLEAVKILLAAGADVNQRGSDGTQAQALAIVSGHDELALFLLEHGADPNSTMYGVGALHAAVAPVDKWLRDWLRARGASVRERATIGLAPTRRLPLVKALLAHGADPNLRITASTVGNVNHSQLGRYGAFNFEQHGTGNLRGATPLWVAADSATKVGNPGAGGAAAAVSSDILDIMRVLLKAGADLSIPTDDLTTPVMMAAGLGVPSRTGERKRGIRSLGAEGAVTLLIEAGADVNAKNEANFTALHGAAFRGWNEMIQILVEHGANINAQDYQTRTPYRIAEQAVQGYLPTSWPETAEFLKKLGADTTLGEPFSSVRERTLPRASDR